MAGEPPVIDKLVLGARDGDVGVLTITFNRPDRLNAFTADGYREFAALLTEGVADPAVRVILVTGAGRAFCSGVDRAALEAGVAAAPALRVGFDELIPALATCPKPLIAAVHGYAVGFGFTMLLHFDFVLVADDARMRAPFVELGVIPEAASSVLLPERIGPQAAAWYLMTGEWIDAADAVRLGIAWRRCGSADDTRAEAVALARRLAAQPPEPVQAAKRLLVEGRRAAVLAAFAREQHPDE